MKVWYNGYGWATCNQVINVVATNPYTIANFDSSFAGRTLRIDGDHIGSQAILKVGGYIGRVVESTPTYSIFEVPPLITPEVVLDHQ